MLYGCCKPEQAQIPLGWSRAHPTEASSFLLSLFTLLPSVRTFFRELTDIQNFLSGCSSGSAPHTKGIHAAVTHDDGLFDSLCCQGSIFIWYLHCDSSTDILEWLLEAEHLNSNLSSPLYWAECIKVMISFLLSIRRLLQCLAYRDVRGLTEA